MSESPLADMEGLDDPEAEVQAVAAQFDEEKADAMAKLGEAAEESLNTVEVDLGADLSVTVKDRLDPRAEQLLKRRRELGVDDDEAANVTAELLSFQVVAPETFTERAVWEDAVEKYGRHYVLVDCAGKILKPAIENVAEAKDNLNL